MLKFILKNSVDPIRRRARMLATTLVVLSHRITCQEGFVLSCQLAKSGEQLPGLELEARQLLQTNKNKLRWPFHEFDRW